LKSGIIYIYRNFASSRLFQALGKEKGGIFLKNSVFGRGMKKLFTFLSSCSWWGIAFGKIRERGWGQLS